MLALALSGCGHGGPARGPTLPLRAACGADLRWDGATCVARTAAVERPAIEAAMAEGDVDRADAALDRAAREPLDHATNVWVWEQRGIAASYRASDEPSPERLAARTRAFAQLLTLDPEHRLSCALANKTTLPFEDARVAAAARGAPELALTWPRDLRLGEPVPIEIETVADPTGVLHTATLYLRPRGTLAWQAADVTLAPPGQYTRVRLPAVAGTEPTALELYATAADPAGNETWRWASAARPRDVALRYDPIPPWYRTWWVWAIAGGVVATGAGIATYALVWEPSGAVGGGINPP